MSVLEPIDPSTFQLDFPFTDIKAKTLIQIQPKKTKKQVVKYAS